MRANADPSPSRERLGSTIRKGVVVAVGVAVLSACRPDSIFLQSANESPAAVEAEAVEHKEAETLLAAATVSLRSTPKEPVLRDPVSPNLSPEQAAFAQSKPVCSATHIGNGRFITASHCFDNDVRADGKILGVPADFLSRTDYYYSAWVQRPSGMVLLGTADALVMNDNSTLIDFALLRVPGAEGQPAVRMADRPALSDEDFLIAGFLRDDSTHQMQYHLEYLGHMNSDDYGDDVETGVDLKGARLLVFGVPKANSNSFPVLQSSGLSGGAIVDASGGAYGTLSRVSMPGKEEWHAFRTIEPNLIDISEDLLLISVINSSTVAKYEALIGRGPDFS